ncbi:MAG: hypothetical protein VCA55_03660 [Verrucomicrobiales bacterium]
MSDPTPVDLSELQFMPDWLKKPSGKAESDNDESITHKDHPPHKPGDKQKGGKKGSRGKREDFNQRGKQNAGNRRHFDDRKKGNFRSGKSNHPRHDREDNRGNRSDSRDRRDNRRAPPSPPQGLSASLQPGQLSITQLVVQIRKTARAYSVFDIARLVLASRDRYSIVFKRDDEKSPELFTCIPDQSAWLSRPEALANLLNTPAFTEHYKEEKVQGELPKGNYNSIAICGISGKLIGPPNHHSYQTQIAKLHRQQFSNMPIGKYKNSIRVEHDEEIIERWKTEQSVEHHYTCQKTPEGEPVLKFETREAAENHFIQTHAEQLITRTDEAVVIGNISGKNLSPALLTLLRQVANNAQKHPASLVQPLCGMLGAEGLKFFKRGKKIFTSITRPKPLSDDSTLSKPILAIVNHIRDRKRASIKSILEDLAPTPTPGDNPYSSPAKPVADKVVEPATDSTPPADESGTKSGTLGQEHQNKENAREPKPEKESPTPQHPELTPEQIAVMKDLHWLLSEGAVIAFGDGHIELATPRVPDNRKKGGKPAPKATPPGSSPQSRKQKIPDPPVSDNPEDTRKMTQEPPSPENAENTDSS